MAELHVQALEIDLPIDRDMYADFCRIAELKDPPPDKKFPDNEGQTDRMLAGGELVLRVTTQRAPDLPPGSASVWRTIAIVLNRALREGSCYDLVERGVGVAAVRATDGADSMTASHEVFTRLKEMGLDEPVGSSVDFLTKSAWSPVVAPIPLWPLPRGVRVAMMTGELFFVAVASGDVWEHAMKATGLQVEVRDKGLLVRGPHRVRFLDRVDLLRLSLGVAFSGISPQDAARAIAVSLEGP